MVTTSPDTYEVYAIKYGTHARMRSENFIMGDPHEGPMPLDFYVWAIVGQDRRNPLMGKVVTAILAVAHALCAVGCRIAAFVCRRSCRRRVFPEPAWQAPLMGFLG